MARFRVSTSIYALMATSLGVGLISSLMLIWRCSDIQSNFAAIQTVEVQQALNARVIQVTFKKQVQEWKDTLLRGDNAEDLEKYSDGFHRQAAKVQELTRTELEQVQDPQVKQILSEFRATHSTLLAHYDTALTHFRETKDAHASDREVRGMDRAPTDLLDKAVELLSQQAKNKLEQQNARTAWVLMCLSAGLALVGLLLAGVTWRFVREITKPLAQLIGVARNIGESGDLNQELDVEREDELGELGRSFAQVVVYLKEMASVSEAIANGDLKVEVEPRSNLDTLGNAFRNMIHGLRGIVGSVRSSAAQVAAGSSQVADASVDSAKAGVHAASAIDEVSSTMHEMSINVRNMVKSTQMQASSVSETSASIEEMVASIQRVADHAKVLLDISGRSRDEVKSGIGTMEKTTAGLNRINGAIGSSATIITSLGQRADNIGKIVEVIDDISEQTNLLALNAAIEAARAGEHGLGFAVVADEVRKLAEKSATSTKEIGELIGSIQSEARKAVDNMEKSTSIVNEGLELGNELSVALHKISNVVTEVYRFAQEIGSATNEQSNGSLQISKATSRLNEITQEINSSVEEQDGGAQAVVRAMERMREMVQQSTSSSTELAASAEHMSKMAGNLMESMGSFAIEDDRRDMNFPVARKPKALAAKPATARS